VAIRDVFTGKLVRNYQRHTSRNRFFFGGRGLTGGDSPWAFFAASVLVLGISGVWFGTTCLWWWLNVSPAVAIVGAYLCLVTISSMLVTVSGRMQSDFCERFLAEWSVPQATRDPGILPRNLDPDPPYPAASPSDGDFRVPMPRDLKVRSDV
jgi:palmitoyltransferase ZDHHC9/14/18